MADLDQQLAPGVERPDPDSGRRPGTGHALLRYVRENWIFGVLVAIVVIFSIASSHFLTQSNWINTSDTATEVLLLAVGETFVIVSGGIDLSVGAVLGLSGMAGGWVMQHFFSHAGLPTGSPALVTAIGFAVTIAVGVIAGLVNGVLIAGYDIPPFVVTLGTLGIATGLADLVSNGQELSTIPATIGNIGNDNIGGWLPVPVLIALACTVIGAVALARTRFGAVTYAIGDNREAARRAGISDGRHLLKVYTLAGTLAGVASITVMSRLGAASPTSGSNDELNAIAAVVIGGASLFGGRGTVVGALIGTCIIAVLLTGLIIINVPSFWQTVTVGVVLIAAVYVDRAGAGERGGLRRMLR
ncbi:MAG TPA: ABC transporter permease [Solirubrobacteraceae bacterium]|nr:ABC transporter permease [Solirubrobacteraceae bacterium]